MELKERIDLLMSEEKITFYELSIKTGIQQSTLSRISNGHTTKLSAKVKSILANYFNVTDEWLANGIGDKNKTVVASAPEEPYINYKDKYVDVLEQLNNVRVELAEAKAEVHRLECILNSAKEDTPSVPGIARGAKVG